MTPATPDTGADLRLELMGTRIRILVGPAARPGLPSPDVAAATVERFLRAYDRALSRFKPDSELCALNADPRPVVPASDLLRSAISAALEAAELSGGLVDPALLDDLVAVGYRDHWDRTRRLDVRDAIATLTRPATRSVAEPGLSPARDLGRRPRRDDLPAARPAPRHGRHRQGPRGRPGRDPAGRVRALGRRLRRRPAGRR